MEKRPQRPMTPFDELITSQDLQMIKLLLPYTPSSNQQFLGVFIKFLELKDTIRFFQDTNHHLHTQAFSRSHPPSPMEMLQDLKPYMPSEQTEMMDTFLNMMNIMEMAQMFQGGSPDFDDIFNSQTTGSEAPKADTDSKDGTDNGSDPDHAGKSTSGSGDIGDMANIFSGGLNPMDMMMGMMTPEQQNMFQLYNHMSANEMDPMGDRAVEDSAVESGAVEDGTIRDDFTENRPLDEGFGDDFAQKGGDINERVDEPSGNEEY